MTSQLNFKEWADEFFPQALRTYERSLLPFEFLTVGTTVLCLRAGFGGGPGVIRTVSSPIITQSNGLRYVELDSNYLLYEITERNGPWYISAYIFSAEKLAEYKSLSTNQRIKWQIQHLGLSFR